MMLFHHAQQKPSSLRGKPLVNPGIWATMLLLISGCSQQPHIEQAATTKPVSAAVASAATEIAALEAELEKTPDDAELHYKLGLAYLADTNTPTSVRSRELAIHHLRNVLKRVPGNAATLKLLYTLYYEDTVAGNEDAFSHASAIFNQLSTATKMEVNAPSLAVFLNRYVLQKQTGNQNLPELYRALLAAIHEQPASDKAYIQLAKMYREENYFPLALATLKLGAEQVSASHDLYRAIADTYEARADASGCSYENVAYISEAIYFYQQAVPLAPDSAALHAALARLYLDKNLYQLALHESSILVEVEPTAENFAVAAQNYSIIGNEPKAQQLLEQAKAHGLSASDASFHEIHMNSGEWNKAALSFTDYLQAQKSISVYDAIKADIIGQQADLDFSALIQKKQLAFNNEWEAAVYAYWTDKITRDQFRQAATNRCERTEYYFYSGYRDYRAGKMVAAKHNFSVTLQQNTYRFIERPLARQFLTGMGAK